MPAQILIADQDTTTRFELGQAFGRMGYQVRATGSIAALLKWVSDGEGDVVIADGAIPDSPVADFVPQIRRLRPRLPVIITSTRRNLATALDAAKSGAFDYMPKPLKVDDVTAAVERALARVAAPDRPRRSDDEVVQLVGQSKAMQKVYRAIARLVGYDLTVLIVGESGSGKELVARALHEYGPRAGGRFVVARPSPSPGDRSMAEWVTGYGSLGKVLEADGGTLYFDDVADLSLDAQIRLLRLVDGSEPVNNPHTGRPVNVRFIASTHHDLKSLIRQGRFREDLYFRLNIAAIALPPLRQRKEDIPELAQAFLQQALRQGLPARVLDSSALERLKAHEWPGNVRELKSVIRRVCLMTDADVITGRMIGQELADPLMAQVAEQKPESEPLSSLVEKHLGVYFLEMLENAAGETNLLDQVARDMQRPFLQISMDYVRGNQVHAARILGMNRNTLRKKLQELGVQPRRGPPPQRSP